MVQDNTDGVGSEQQNATVHRPLTNPMVKGQLIVELALDEIPQSDLAIKYGVNKSSITRFKNKNMDAIEARRERLMDQYQDLWISAKYTRLATLQTVCEDLLELTTTPRTAEVIDKLLRAAAEELGDLEKKLAIEVAEYRITGIDLDKL